MSGCGNKLVPINKRWNIAELIEALRAYPRSAISERDHGLKYCELGRV